MSTSERYRPDQRTLEEAVAGTALPRQKYKNLSSQRTINPFTGMPTAGRPRRKLTKPENSVRFKAPGGVVPVGSKVLPKDRPGFNPDKERGLFEAIVARNQTVHASKIRASVPPGYGHDHWRTIFRGRLKKARKIVDKIIERNEVNGFDNLKDAHERNLETDDGKAAAALDYCTAVVMSPEMGVAERRQHAALVLRYTKQTPAERKDVKISAEDFLQTLADEVGV